MWEGRCSISGVAIPNLLSASHIKPWVSSNNQERLDPMNGLLLLPQYDAAFDSGLITFDKEGLIVISPTVSIDELSRAGIERNARLRFIHTDHGKYLEHHRSASFNGGADLSV
jgi:putative restriction endonuclease